MFELFEKIGATNSKNEKKELLAEADMQQLELLEACYNPYKQYHVRKWSPPLQSRPFISKKIALISFFDLLNTLQNNNRSNELMLAVTSFLGKCDDMQYKYFSAVIRKDMRIGINTATINEVHKDLIPTFKVMLAERYGEGTISEFPLDPTAIYQPKLDGFRSVLLGWDDAYVGRSGKTFPNAELAEKLEGVRINMALDGELYLHGYSSNAISSIVMTLDKQLPLDLKCIVWDTIPKQHWLQRKSTWTCKDRILAAERTVGQLGNNFFKTIQSIIVLEDDSYEEGHADFIDMTTGEVVLENATLHDLYNYFLEQGFEGIMVKNPNGVYEWKRSKNMYKIKPLEYTSAEIIGIYEGTGKYKGKMGGLEVVTEEGIETNVGGGFSDAERKEFWKNPPIGLWCKLKYTEKTKSIFVKKVSLRHARFISIRDEK